MALRQKAVLFSEVQKCRKKNDMGQLCLSISGVLGSTGDIGAVSIPEAGLVAMYCTALRNIADVSD